MTSVAIIATDPARFTAADTLRDPAELLPALRARGADAHVADWLDPDVDWARFDLVVLRSPWDYSLRPAEFSAWLDRVGAVTRVLNDPVLVRWNMDKRYLAELEGAGIPGVPTTYHDAEDTLVAALAAASSGARPATSATDSESGSASASAPTSGPGAAAAGGGAEPAHVVLKPTVGAGAQLTGLLRPEDPAALTLGREILAERRTVMLQPEVPELSAGREKALYLIDGRFTHAISKGALLARGGGLRGGTYREDPQLVEADAAEREFAERVLAACAEVTGTEMPLYARIDLVDSAEHGLVLLEAELFEPLFNLPLVPAVTEVFAEAILARASATSVTAGPR